MSNKSSPPNRLRSIVAEDVVKPEAASMESSAASDYSLFMNHGNTNTHLVRLSFHKSFTKITRFRVYRMT